MCRYVPKQLGNSVLVEAVERTSKRIVVEVLRLDVLSNQFSVGLVSKNCGVR